MFGFRSKPKDTPREQSGPKDPAATPAPASPAPEKPSLFARLRAQLNRGDSWLTYDLANLLPGGKIDDTVLDELETRLITADVGVETTERILGGLRKKVARKELGDLNA